MDPIAVFHTLIELGVSDVYINGKNSVWARGPEGVAPLSSLLVQATHSGEVRKEDAQNIFTFIAQLLGQGEGAGIPKSALEDFSHKKRLDLALALPNTGLRVRLHGTYANGAPIYVLRLIGVTPSDVEVLGLPRVIQERLSGLTRHKTEGRTEYRRTRPTRSRGLFLVTGPTGAGKSTTLAGLLQFIADNLPYHILTLEDPLEYVIRSRTGKALVTQKELHRDFLTFPQGLKDALRESPDVVMVGEMRDLDTIRWALALAEAGFLVLATFHTNSVQETIERIIGSFPANEQNQVRIRLASTLIGVLSQNLVPLKKPLRGRPRAPIFEYLFMSLAARNMIREGKTHQLHTEFRPPQGMTMTESALHLYKQGLADADTLLGIVNDPEELSKRLKGAA